MAALSTISWQFSISPREETKRNKTTRSANFVIEGERWRERGVGEGGEDEEEEGDACGDAKEKKNKSKETFRSSAPRVAVILISIYSPTHHAEIPHQEGSRVRSGILPLPQWEDEIKMFRVINIIWPRVSELPHSVVGGCWGGVGGDPF